MSAYYPLDNPIGDTVMSACPGPSPEPLPGTPALQLAASDGEPLQVDAARPGMAERFPAETSALPALSDRGRADDLATIQADFPLFRVWREEGWGRVRYVAWSRVPGQHPHAVVTADVGELRAVLGAAENECPAESRPAGPGLRRFDPGVANPARVYGYWLGSKDHYPADRQAAEQVASCCPQVVAGARANRAFGARVTRRRADSGNWALPGGGMEMGESLTGSVIREVEEETGYEVEVTGLVGTYTDPAHIIVYSDGEVRRQFNICYAARILRGELRISDESTALRFIDPAELDGLPMHPTQRLRLRHYLERRAEPYLG